MEAITTPLRLLEKSVVREVARGMGAGMKVEHLKNLDYLLDKARNEAGANNLLQEFEKTVGAMTANLNIIRPGLLLGLMARLDLDFRDFELMAD